MKRLKNLLNLLKSRKNEEYESVEYSIFIIADDPKVKKEVFANEQNIKNITERVLKNTKTINLKHLALSIINELGLEYTIYITCYIDKRKVYIDFLK